MIHKMRSLETIEDNKKNKVDFLA